MTTNPTPAGRPEYDVPHTTPIHLEPRAFSSPCASCPTPIPDEITVYFATADGTICDQCAATANPPSHRALNDLRHIDTTFWSITNGQDAATAQAYLLTLVRGALVMFEAFATPRTGFFQCNTCLGWFDHLDHGRIPTTHENQYCDRCHPDN